MATHIPLTICAEPPVSMAMSNESTMVTSDWKTQLPVLQAKGITLRELRVSDHGVRHAYLRERLAAVGVPSSMEALWD